MSKLRSSQESNIEYFNTFITKNGYSEYPFNPKGIITSEARYSSVFDNSKFAVMLYLADNYATFLIEGEE